VSFDPDLWVNTLKVIEVRYNATTGESEEVTHGPYTDAVSFREWGPLPGEYRVQGVADVDAWAADLLEANSTPENLVDKIRVPIRDTADLVATKALLDLYTRVRVVNADLGVDKTMRVLGVDHSIDSRGRWWMDLSFGSEEGAAGSVSVAAVAATVGPQEGVWVLVGSGGTAPAFAGAWVNSGGADMTVRFMRKNGRTYIDGLAKTGAIGTAVFTLPPGFRPAANTQRASMASGNVVARLSIAAAGTVTVVSGSNVWVSLACDFEAEA
jgi:hypothetical protein